MVTTAVLAYDLGTGGCKAALVDETARVLAAVFRPYPTTYPISGWHEQRPEDWWQAVVTSTRQLVAGLDEAVEIAAIGLSGHSLAMVPVGPDATHPLLDMVPIWSDVRGEQRAAAYFAQHDETAWYRKTGNGFPRGMYTVFKAAWLLEEHPSVAERTVSILGSKDWINARLTGVTATDPSYASGSGAYNMARRSYMHDEFDALGIPATWWPSIRPSAEPVGSLTPAAADELGLRAGTTVVTGGVDNSCMALGAGVDRDAQAYMSLGSSNWISVASQSAILDDTVRPFVFDHVIPGLYVSALSTFGGGSSLEWLVHMIGRDGDIDALVEEVSRVPVGANGVVCVPTLAGGTVAEGGPEVRGAFTGLDLRHNHADLARAVLEGVGFSLETAAATMLARVPAGEPITAIGGGARSREMLQILADLLDRPVVRPAAEQHGAALGAATLAHLGVGSWTDTSPLHAGRTIALRVTPDPSRRMAYDLARARFAASQSAARSLAELSVPNGARHDTR